MRYLPRSANRSLAGPLQTARRIAFPGRGLPACPLPGEWGPGHRRERLVGAQGRLYDRDCLHRGSLRGAGRIRRRRQLHRSDHAPDTASWPLASGRSPRPGQLSSSSARPVTARFSALDGVVSIDHRGRLTYVNAAAKRMFGCRADEVLGRELAEMFVTPSLRDAHRRGFARYLTTGETRILNRRIEITALRADGSEFPPSWSSPGPTCPADPPSSVTSATSRSVGEPRKTWKLRGGT